MLSWALIFCIVALVAAFFGFRGTASLATSFAKILFFLALIVIILSLFGVGIAL